MQPGLPRSWKTEFALAAAIRRDDILHKEKLDAFHQRQRLLRERETIRREHRDREDMLAVLAAAPPARIAVFKDKLDRYETATVAALLDNETAMENVQDRLEAALGKAHVLADGRRVFKTIDGQSVYDEHGQKLGIDLVDPLIIEDHRPRWEAYNLDRTEKLRLIEQRDQLLSYQSRLDTARDRLNAGEITEHELNELEGLLDTAMPTALRQRLDDGGGDAPDAAKLGTPNLDDLGDSLRRTGLGPRVGPEPG